MVRFCNLNGPFSIEETDRVTDPNPHLPPPLPPLAHRAPEQPFQPAVSSGVTVLRFFAGLVLGAAVSAIIWIGGWSMVEHGSGTVILIVPGIKLTIGIACLFFRGWR